MLRKLAKKIFYSLKHVDIYMLHHVSTDGPFYSGCRLDTDKFYDFVDSRKDDIISLSDALTSRLSKANGKCVLTFDDGLYDIYTIAYPYLVEHNIPFTAFICPKLLDTEGYITAAQLKEMSQNPLVTIGSHGMTHVILKGLDVETQDYETSESRKELEKIIGKDVNIFAYSHGQYDKISLKMLKKHGYKYAMSTVQYPYNCFTKRNRYIVPRLNVENKTIEKYRG